MRRQPPTPEGRQSVLLQTAARLVGKGHFDQSRSNSSLLVSDAKVPFVLQAQPCHDLLLVHLALQHTPHPLHFGGARRRPWYHRPELIARHFIHQKGFRPAFQHARDTSADASIRQDADRVIGQGRIASVRLTLPDLLRAQAVGQMAGTDDLDPVSENQQANRCTGEIVAVEQRVDGCLRRARGSNEVQPRSSKIISWCLRPR